MQTTCIFFDIHVIGKFEMSVLEITKVDCIFTFFSNS